ncbi:hypothetical protein H5410_042144 [Solanum commersonii]|uniref:Uncharacterized protein n=1 Tax=Solanum commersonii TaxID=4109 RepID=A0A9J5XXM4_SOLCO|nr:hypothetical protein H5410_042144 [Solanum commersonii]
MHSAIRPLVYFIAFQLLPSASLRFGSLGDIVLLRGTVQRRADCSFFFADLIFSFKAQHSGILGEVKTIRRLTECIRRFSSLLFFVFLAVLFFFAK